MSDEREVYFYEYCPKCQYSDIEDFEDPCNDCLGTPNRINSHKPINFKEKDETQKTKKRNKKCSK